MSDTELLETYAGQAMAALLNRDTYAPQDLSAEIAKEIAEHSFIVAEAMVEAADRRKLKSIGIMPKQKHKK